LEIGAYLTGRFGQTEELYKANNEYKRGRGPKKDVDKEVLKRSKEVIKAQKKAGLDFIIDPMLDVYGIMRPFAEELPGIEGDPDKVSQHNWFNNNRFYAVPEIHDTIQLKAAVEQHSKSFTLDYLKPSLLPKNKDKVAVLPSPYTILKNSYVVEQIDSVDTGILNDLSQLIKKEAWLLAENGYKLILIDEPTIVYRQRLGSRTGEDLELLNIALRGFDKISNAKVMLHTYWGTAGPRFDDDGNLVLETLPNLSTISSASSISGSLPSINPKASSLPEKSQ